MSENIENCPNCKGGNVTVPGVKSVLHQVKCSGCGMRGPEFQSEAGAIALWNQLSIAMEWARLLIAADEAHPGFAASVLAAGKAATK